MNYWQEGSVTGIVEKVVNAQFWPLLSARGNENDNVYPNCGLPGNKVFVGCSLDQPIVHKSGGYCESFTNRYFNTA